MRFIIFNQAKTDGETTPKVIRLTSQVAINPEHIISYFQVLDKFDKPLPGILAISVNNMGTVYVFAEFESMATRLKEADYSSQET